MRSRFCKILFLAGILGSSFLQARCADELEDLSPRQWKDFFRSFYSMGTKDDSLLIISDYPGAEVHDSEIPSEWTQRPAVLVDMKRKLQVSFPHLRIQWLAFERSNRGMPLPSKARLIKESFHEAPPLRGMHESGEEVELADYLQNANMIFAATEFSMTARLTEALDAQREVDRLAGVERPNPLKGASAIGFNAAIIPALMSLTENHEKMIETRDKILGLLNGSHKIEFRFKTRRPVELKDGSRKSQFILSVDVRKSVWMGEPRIGPRGGVDNVPRGEVWGVPVDGVFAESGQDPVVSRTHGEWALQPNPQSDEIVVLRMENNHAVEILSEGPESDKMAQRFAEDPAYRNLAEVGWGYGASFKFPVLPAENSSAVVNNEKLKPHLALGRNNYWPRGGVDCKWHDDFVYHEVMQPGVRIEEARLFYADQSFYPMYQFDNYVLDPWQEMKSFYRSALKGLFSSRETRPGIQTQPVLK